MRCAIVLLYLAAVAGYGLTTVYKVAPKCASYSGWTDTVLGRRSVSEVLTLNADELVYSELFSGAEGTPQYNLSVLTYPGGFEVASGETTEARNHVWVRCSLQTTHAESLVRGKRYEFHWSRANGARIQFYYNYCATRYDSMIVPGEDQPPPQPVRPALAMRCLGRMNAVDSTLFGASGIVPWWARDTWPVRAGEAGVGWATKFFYWEVVESTPGSWTWSETDLETRSLCESVPSVVGVIMQCPPWVSSRPRPDTWTYSSKYAAPRNLWAPAEDDTNYLARYLRALMYHTDGSGRPSDNIHTWEIWNEPNEGCTLYVSGDTYRGYTGFWRQPDSQFYPNDGGLADMSALYMKLASVAAQTIRSCTLYGANHRNDRILIGSLGRVDFESLDLRLYKGREWLEACYEAAQDSNYGIFWDGVSVHPYHYDNFSADTLEKHSRILREIMRGHGDYGVLWSTEFGWPRDAGNPPESQRRAARVIAETFVSTEGSKSLAQGGLDRMCWWVFSEAGSKFGGEPLADSAMNRYPAFFAFKQMTGLLTGKRFNGRVMTGDIATDPLVRMYEFENPATLKRTWVCWKNGSAESGGLSVKLPVRTDSLRAEWLAYTGTPSPFSAPVAPDGWLSLSLNERPAFVTEVTDTLRSNLRVDSVKCSPSPGPMYVKAWVTNHGSRATPHNPSGMLPYPTWAVLSRNGDSLTRQVYTDSIAVGHQVEFTFNLSSSPSNSTLFSVLVNPLQAYVELGTDDNAGHALAIKP